MDEKISFRPSCMKVTICKECKGLGFYVDENGDRRDCSYCGGTGRFVVEKREAEIQLADIKGFLNNEEEEA